MLNSNLLSVIWLLQARGRMTAEELSSALEVSVRTIYRYIDILCAGGAPIVAEPGHNGGYSLSKGFRGTPLFFSPQELTAMTQAFHFAEGLGYPHVAELRSSLRKVGSSLTADQLAQLRRSAQTMQSVLSRRGGPVLPWLGELDRAVTDRATLAIEYRKSGSTTTETRVIDPYGVVSLRGLWYLAAYCHTRQGLRDFRVDRIAALARTGSRFSPPDHFSLADHFARYLPTPSAGPLTSVTLTGTPSALESLRYDGYFSADVTEAAPHSLRLLLGAEKLEHMAAVLLTYGTDIRVVAPATLREQVAALALRLVQHHQEAAELP